MNNIENEFISPFPEKRKIEKILPVFYSKMVLGAFLVPIFLVICAIFHKEIFLWINESNKLIIGDYDFKIDVNESKQISNH